MTDIDPDHKGPYTYEMLHALLFAVTNNKFYTRSEWIRYINQIIHEWQKLKP